MDAGHLPDTEPASYVTPEVTPVSWAAAIGVETHRSELTPLSESSHAQEMSKAQKSPSCVDLYLKLLPAKSHVHQVLHITVVCQAGYGIPFGGMM